MAKVLDVFSLLKEKEQEIRENGQSWMDFLKSSSYTNKYSFNDQLLIYANKPDAKACASMEFWNKRFYRWINKGAKGIPLIDVDAIGNTKIKYVFDIADTHPTKYTEKDVEVWKFENTNKIHKEAFTNIENREGFFNTENTYDLQTRLFNIVEKISEDYREDLLHDILSQKEKTTSGQVGQKLKHESHIELITNKLLINSTKYHLMERMGVEPNEYFSDKDFNDIGKFNSSELVATLSNVISKISKEFIFDLKKEIIRLEKREQNNLQDNTKLSYNKEKTNKTKIQSIIEKEDKINHGGDDNGNGDVSRSSVRSDGKKLQSNNQNLNIRKEWRDLSSSRGSIDTKFINGESDADGDRNLWKSKEEISRGDETSKVFINDNKGNTSNTLNRSGTASTEIIGTRNSEVDESMGSERRSKKSRPDEMGRINEQYQVNNRGDNLQGNSIQLEKFEQLSLFPTEQEQIKNIKETVDKNSAVFSISQEKIDTELMKGSGFENGKMRIYDFFKTNPTLKEGIDFLKKEYGTGGWSSHSKSGEITSSMHNAKGIKLIKNNDSELDTEILLKWKDVEKRIRFLIENNRYLLTNEITSIDPDENPKNLFTERMKELTPKFYDTENIMLKDKMVQAIYFVPLKSNWSWYLIEYDKRTGDAFGLVAGDTVEWGYFNLNELKEIGGERLINFIPKTFEKLKEAELKNQLTESELYSAFGGELSFEREENRHELTSGQVGQKLENNKKAVGVGYSFNVFDEDILNNIELEETSTNLVVDKIEYKLYKAKTFEDSEKVDKLLDIYGELHINEYDLRAKENNVVKKTVTNKPEVSYYIIEDLSTWSTNAPIKSKLERFDNLGDAVSKFKEYRNNDYDYSDGKAKLTLGASIGMGEIDVLHVSNNENYLVSDFTGIPNFSENQYFLDDLLKLENSLGFDKIRLFKNEAGERLKEPLVLDYKDWNNTYFKNEKLNYHISNDELGFGTSRDKSLTNIKAIRILKNIENENRFANFEEQEVLSNYVGWGGLSEVFDKESNLTWAKSSYKILKEILTDDEFKSARESTLNAHYTSPTIIRAMYKGLEKLGFKTGNILEPSCGTGNFIGMLPENMNSSKFYGVELDDITGRIAKQL